MACSNAVAMFMCVSSVCFRAVNSGRAVMAVFRWAALLVKSLHVAQKCICSERRQFYSRREARGQYLHLRNVIYVADTRAPCDLCSIRLVPERLMLSAQGRQLSVSSSKPTSPARHLSPRQRSGTAVRHVWPKRNPWCQSRRTFSASCHSPGRSNKDWESAVREGVKVLPTYFDGYSVQFHFEDVMNKCLVRPRVTEHRNQVDITIQYDEHCMRSTNQCNFRHQKMERRSTESTHKVVAIRSARRLLSLHRYLQD